MAVAVDLAGQVVIVTGAVGGIGSAIARRLAVAGATVVVHARSSPERAHALAEEIGGLACLVDLTEADAAASIVEQTLDRLGSVRGLVNNAAIQPLAPLADVGEADWAAMIDTNLTAAHRLSQAAAAAMVDGGWITHIGSIEATTPAVDHGHYAVAKAGLVMHAKAAALEWGRRAIRVNTVSPGLIDRPGLRDQWPEGVDRWEAAAPLGRLGRPDDIADACLFLASDLARWVTGHELVVDGGVSTHPSW
jgi:NAD(P)-dependent dehydrogenase (short-subunit alcohol dehydrogenase family)